MKDKKIALYNSKLTQKQLNYFISKIEVVDLRGGY